MLPRGIADKGIIYILKGNRIDDYRGTKYTNTLRTGYYNYDKAKDASGSGAFMSATDGKLKPTSEYLGESYMVNVN